MIAKSVIVGSGETIYWSAFNNETETWTDLAYVQIVLKEKENIIGYAIIEIKKDPEFGLNYHAETLKSIIFPKVKEHYQSITEEYVNTAMANIIAERD